MKVHESKRLRSSRAGRASLVWTLIGSLLLGAPLAALTQTPSKPAPSQQEPKGVPPAEVAPKLPAPAPAAPPRDYPQTGVLVSPDEDYIIGAGDVIEVVIDDAPELSGSFRVSANGKIRMRHLDRVQAQGKTPDDLALFVADALRGEYLANPNVTVVVKQVNSRSYFIQGAINRPGVYQLEGTPSLLKLMALAGGLAQNHGSTAFIIRENKPSPAATAAGEPGEPSRSFVPASNDSQKPKLYTEENLSLIKMNINGLFKGRFDQNMSLQPGDIVNVPQTDVFFVGGDVKAPGSFSLREGTTLRMAISLAQGINFTASAGKGIIFRENPETGERSELRIDIGAVMGGKKPDEMIYPNDIIIVPNSKLKTIAIPLITGFGTSLMYSAVWKIIY